MSGSAFSIAVRGGYLRLSSIKTQQVLLIDLTLINLIIINLTLIKLTLIHLTYPSFTALIDKTTQVLPESLT